MQVGRKFFAEMFPPQELVRQAVLAEEAGFDFVEISGDGLFVTSPDEGVVKAFTDHGGSRDVFGEMFAAEHLIRQIREIRPQPPETPYSRRIRELEHVNHELKAELTLLKEAFHGWGQTSND